MTQPQPGTEIFSPIPCQREAFGIPEDIAYFNCAYLSPLLRSVKYAGERAIDRKGRPWEIAPANFFDESDRLRSLFARVIGARTGDVALIPSVSYGISIAAKNIALAAGKAIVMLAEQFPSNVYPWMDLAKSRGLSLRVVPRPAAGDWTSAVLAAIDGGTGLVALPNCHWTDGSLVDLIAVGGACRERGIPLVLDITQSLGAVPFSIEQVRPAFLVTAGYKWLLGPYSLAYMYVAPEYQQGVPLEFNWIGRENSEDFAGLVRYTERMAPSARRYDVGERSNFTLVPMAEAALTQILDWGIGDIEATLTAYNRELSKRVAGLGFETVEDRHRAGHLMGLRFQGKLPQTLAAALAEQKIYVSIRGDAIRLSPHLYNNENDRDRLVNALKKLL